MIYTDLSTPENAQLAGRTAGTLYRTNFLTAIHPDTAIHLVKHGGLISAEAGDVIARQDEGPDRLIVLLSGAIDVRSGQRVIGRLDRRGDVVGELSVLGIERATAQVVAETAVQAFTITTTALGREEFVAPAATLYQAMSYSLANCLRALSARVDGRPDRAAGRSGIDLSTGLPTRQRLDELLDALSTAQNGLPYSLAIARIDAAADADAETLAQLGETLRHNIRHDDLAARIDDTRFGIVLPNCDAKNAQRVLSGLHEALRRELGEATARFCVASRRLDEGPIAMMQRVHDALSHGDGEAVVSAD